MLSYGGLKLKALAKQVGGRLTTASPFDRQPIADHDRQPIATHTGVTGKNLQSDRQKTVKVTGNPLPPNPLNEPLEEPTEVERDSPQLDLAGEDSGRRGRSPSSETETEAGFEEFYRHYPKHVAKAAALKAYRAAIKRGVTPGVILAGAMRAAADFDQHVKRRGREEAHQFTKNPATWLNAECWSDEPAKPIGGDAYGAPPPAGHSHHIAVAETIARQLMERDGDYVQ